MGRFLITTYGCQMNVYDSDRMADILSSIGYSKAYDIEDANLVIINTCAIREKATEKTYSELGRIRKHKEKRGCRIIVAGCVGQAEGEEIFKRVPFVDAVVGPQSYHALPAMLKQLDQGASRLLNLEFVENAKFDELPEQTMQNGHSAFVSVQEGCDQMCTFCVVPYTRGAEYSRKVEQIYREVLKFVNLGIKEVTLLGQNVNAYAGVDFQGNTVTLAGLIKILSAIPQLARIRYTTSHPINMSDDLIALHGTEPKLMPFLHLPVQSGSNAILKSMNRKYTREYYLDLVDKIRSHKPEIALSTDIIVGFPGETDQDFEQTMDLVRQVRFSQTFSFKYSIRPGTPAANKEQVPDEIKTKRLILLQEELSRQQLEFNKACIGMVMPVLFEQNGKYEGQILGKTPYMQSVHITNPSAGLIGQIANVHITHAFLNSLTGLPM